MTPREQAIFDACPRLLRPMLLIAGDAWYMLTFGHLWGHGTTTPPRPTVGDTHPDRGD